MTTNTWKWINDVERGGVVSNDSNVISAASDDTIDAFTKLMQEDVPNTNSDIILTAVLDGIDNSNFISSWVDLFKAALDSDNLELLADFVNVERGSKEWKKRLAIMQMTLISNEGTDILKNMLESNKWDNSDQLSQLKDAFLSGYDIEKVRSYLISRADNAEFITRCDMVNKDLAPLWLKIRRPSSDYFITPEKHGAHQYFDIVAA